jgi:hypothetical protein
MYPLLSAQPSARALKKTPLSSQSIGSLAAGYQRLSRFPAVVALQRVYMPQYNLFTWPSVLAVQGTHMKTVFVLVRIKHSHFFHIYLLC